LDEIRPTSSNNKISIILLYKPACRRRIPLVIDCAFPGIDRIETDAKLSIQRGRSAEGASGGSSLEACLQTTEHAFRLAPRRTNSLSSMTQFDVMGINRPWHNGDVYGPITVESCGEDDTTIISMK